MSIEGIPEPPGPGFVVVPPPPGPDFVVAPDPRWRLVDGKLCRRIVMVDGVRRKCGAPSVAETNRGLTTKRQGYQPLWWPYCAAHLYGRWVVDDTVYGWTLPGVDLS